MFHFLLNKMVFFILYKLEFSLQKINRVLIVLLMKKLHEITLMKNLNNKKPKKV